MNDAWRVLFSALAAVEGIRQMKKRQTCVACDLWHVYTCDDQTVNPHSRSRCSCDALILAAMPVDPKGAA